jgi:hypothetical protein
MGMLKEIFFFHEENFCAASGCNYINSSGNKNNLLVKLAYEDNKVYLLNPLTNKDKFEITNYYSYVANRYVNDIGVPIFPINQSEEI